MKKIILLMVLVVIQISYVKGQTYYQCVEKIDSNGAKIKSSGGAYLTFTAGKKSCYLSDEKGNKKSPSTDMERVLDDYVPMGDNGFRYAKSQNGVHVYDNSYIISYGGMSMSMPATTILYFNSTYTKLIVPRIYIGGQYVFEKTDGPYDDSIPVF